MSYCAYDVDDLNSDESKTLFAGALERHIAQSPTRAVTWGVTKNNTVSRFYRRPEDHRAGAASAHRHPDRGGDLAGVVFYSVGRSGVSAKTSRSRPEDFARYSASSARRSGSFTLAPGCSSALPML